MEMLHLFASPEQRRRWLEPLMNGEIRSVISITEPDTASSDPTNLQTTIRREGGEYVINGRKWFQTGAQASECKILHRHGRVQRRRRCRPHRKHSFVIVPLDTPA